MKYRFLFFLLVLVCSIFFCQSQTLLKNFQVKVKGSGEVRSIAEDGAGNYLLAGNFDLFENFQGTDQVPVSSIVKVDENGQRILAFNIPLMDGVVKKIKVLRNGFILASGDFSKVNGLPRNQIVRLTATGQVDLTFNFSFPYSDILDFDVQSNDNAIILIKNQEKRQLVRISSEGTPDINFNYLAEGEFLVNLVVVDKRDRLVIGGDYINSAATNAFACIKRLSKDGLVDTSFQIGFLFSNGVSLLRDIKLIGQNEILIGGGFEKYNSVAANKLVRLDSLGNPVKIFSENFGNGLDMEINSVTALPNGKIAICGLFTTYFGVPASIIIFKSDGTLDSIAALTSSNGNQLVYSDSKNRLFLCGAFSFVYGTGFSYVQGRHQIALFNSDYSLNSTFRPLLFSLSISNALAVQTDGHIMLGGNSHQMINPRTSLSEPLWRAKPNGQFDNSFKPNATFVNISRLEYISNDQFIAGGVFNLLNGSAYTGITLMNNLGGVDESFSASKNIYSDGYEVSVLSTEIKGDKVFIGGAFSGFNGFASPAILKLNREGSHSTDFLSRLPKNANVYNLKVLNDGKILACGYFPFNASGLDPSFLVRLNTDGSIDQTFQQYKGIVQDFGVDSDGGIVIGSHNKVVKLKANGALDSNFSQVSFSGNYVVIDNVIVLEDRRIVITGNFTKVNGFSVNSFAILDKNGQELRSVNLGLWKNSKIKDVVYKNRKLYLLGGIFTDSYQSSVGIVDLGPPPLVNTTILLTGESTMFGTKLNWQSSSLDGIDGYVVERTSVPENLVFSTLDSIKTFNNFSFTDQRMQSDTDYFYRMIAYNKDFKSQSRFSNVVAGTLITETSKIRQLTIYPNPVANSAWIEIPADEIVYSTKVLNINGVEASGATLEREGSGYKIDLGSLPTGLYNIIVSTKMRTLSIKIVKI
jgi:uncharacterized delta-60 repeat protein